MKDDARIAGEFERYKVEKEREIVGLKARITVLEADRKAAEQNAHDVEVGPRMKSWETEPEPEPILKGKKGAKKD